MGVDTNYDISETGQTRVSHEVTLTNNFSTIHAASYIFNLEGTKADNVTAAEGQNKLPVEIENSQNITTIKVQFPEAIVGKDKSRTFVISYDNSTVATKNGKVWEITIPKLLGLESYDKYNLSLSIPKQFGELAYLSPKPLDMQEGEKLVYMFSASQLATSGVTAAFGDSQVFGFELFYHLQNPYDKKGETEIALPPDSAFQKVYYTLITPNPIAIRLDEEGNWLAKYRLQGNEKLDVKATGAVQLFTSPQENRTIEPINPLKYLSESIYWQTNDPAIINTAKSLKTPRQVYDFVVGTLTYDYSRVKEGVSRLGASQALLNPTSAICMEFTDLFIALARASGIPAREVNGYAYTENLELQPLSLVADVLHAWPEYWDSEKNIWIPVDPTWGNTTGGLDFFSKLDLSHFAFVFHGTNPEEPLPAGSYKFAENPQKDVSIFFSTLPDNSKGPELSIDVNKQLLPFLPLAGELSITNNGPSAMYDVRPKFSASSGEIKYDERIKFLPPFTTKKIEFSWSPSSFIYDKSVISVLLGSQEVKYTIGIDFLIWQTFGVFLVLTLVTSTILALIFSRKKLKYAFRKTSKIQKPFNSLTRHIHFPRRKW